MAITVNIHEAKTYLLQRVSAGEEIILAQAGTLLLDSRVVACEDVLY